MKDQTLLESIVREMVTYPDEVRVDRIVDELGVLLTIHLDQQDLGCVVGKGGETIQSIRRIMRPIGFKLGSRINVKVYDENYQNNYQ